MLQGKTNKFNHGFTLVEVLLSMTISLAVFWGLMTLYLDVAENHTEDQIVEEIRFNITTAMDRMVEDIRAADEIKITTTPFSKKIKIMEIDDQTGEVSDEHYYTAKYDEGILYDGEPMHLPGYHLFDDDGPYLITIEEFEFEATLNDYDTSKNKLQENFYDLTVIFKLSLQSDETFERIYTYEQRLFALNKFSMTPNDES